MSCGCVGAATCYGNVARNFGLTIESPTAPPMRIAATPGRETMAGADPRRAEHHRQAVRQPPPPARSIRSEQDIASRDMIGRSPYHSVDTTPVGPSPFVDCGSEAAEPHIRSPLIAAGTKIPHTRGRRARKGDQSLSRHLAARTLCGPPAEIGQGSASLADAWVLRDVASLRHAAFNTAPSGTSPCVT
jgi:hypothetical protein